MHEKNNIFHEQKTPVAFRQRDKPLAHDVLTFLSALALQQAAEMYSNTDNLVNWQYLVPDGILMSRTECEINFSRFLTSMYRLQGYAK
jgi:hypothetical protein